MDCINESEIHSLIEYFSRTMYRAKNADQMGKDVMQKCVDLAKLDYNVTVLDNSTGELCAHYPSYLIIMDSENSTGGTVRRDTIYESNENARLRELVVNARTARCRTRFPVPVILFGGKFICRSATLSGSPEIYSRSGLNYLFPRESTNFARGNSNLEGESMNFDGESTNFARGNSNLEGESMNFDGESTNFARGNSNLEGESMNFDGESMNFDRESMNFDKESMNYEEESMNFGEESLDFAGQSPNSGESPIFSIESPNFSGGIKNGVKTVNEDENDNGQNNLNNSRHWVLCDQVRKDDIKLLKSLSVGTIVDFMVEKKKVKFGLNVTSSEKVDKEKRYSQFTILSLPYPGCEFFKEFRDQNYTAENLYYNWSQAHVDAEIIVPQDTITDRVPVKWKDYKKWNLLSLTGNYLLLLLHYTCDSNSGGMLIHCISGWDRTPLFTSLLRICLWADGAIHKSLTPIQLLYFTIAYDWLLFGHDLQDRKNKGEDIFYFCFHFLKYLMGDEYSIPRKESKFSMNRDSTSMLRNVDDFMHDSGELDAAEMIACPQGSTHSLNSSWSSISSKSQEINSSSQSEDNAEKSGGILIGEGSDLSDTQRILVAKMSQAASTSPVAVPSPPRTGFRQRNESTSSLNVGSWQYVTSTGSLRSSGSTISSRSSGPDATITDSTSTVVENPVGCFIKRKQSDDHSQCGSSCAMRRERLEQIRKLFANCYCQSIGHTLKDGSDSSGLSNIIGNIAGKIYQKS